MASLSLRHLSKTYDNGVNAIKDVTLEVDDKEFMVLAGPVGCGISTVLRMIAGVEDITDGELLVDGERMNETPSIDRDMAMIFKNGKLYPQMNIYDNLAFGLKLKELPAIKANQRFLPQKKSFCLPLHVLPTAIFPPFSGAIGMILSSRLLLTGC